jgi:hypothetical protein
MRAIAEARAGGARLESLQGNSAVIVRGRPPTHTAHFLLTIVSLGVWGPVWVAWELFGGERRELLSLSESGEVARRNVRKWTWWTRVAILVALCMIPVMLAIWKYG